MTASTNPPALPIDAETDEDDAAALVTAWIERHVPEEWRTAAPGGAAAIRRVRSRSQYEQWYPVFGASGLVVPTWLREHGGLATTTAVARRIDRVLAPYNLGRLNPLGLNLVAPALFAQGNEDQRRRFLPPLVRNEEVWCQLFSEPGAGSDLASLATRAERHGDGWRITGQKVWTTWAHLADHGVLLARTDADAPKRKGITYFLIDLHQPGVEVRPLRHITGEIDFNEVFLDGAYVPDTQRVGEIGDGWRVANATLTGERQMVSGAGSGGVDRIGGSGVTSVVEEARRLRTTSPERGTGDPIVRQRLMRLHSEDRIRDWTNQRARAGRRANRASGPESSIGKVHQGDLNQRLQLLATDLLGPGAMAWEPTEPADRAHDGGAGTETGCAPDGYATGLPYTVRGMLRSRANTIEGGTTEVNKNILGERVLGLPREPDPWQAAAWRDVPRNG